MAFHLVRIDIIDLFFQGRVQIKHQGNHGTPNISSIITSEAYREFANFLSEGSTKS